MASMSISGVVSGMDWESMIDEIISAASKPAQVQVTKRTDLKNKKTLYEEMKVMVQSIQSSMTSLKLPSTYKAKDIDIERVDTSGSYKKVLTATVNADAEVNIYDISVDQIATAQTNKSNQITASTLASTLSTGGVTSPSTMYITAGGQRVGIDVYSTDSLQSLKSRINNTIKSLDTPMNLTASVVDNRLILRSDSTGLGITSSSATTRYTGSSSIIPGMAYDDTGTISVRSGNTTYTQGTDYEIVNGNEIRWNQYTRGDEVALGDSMTVNYTMAKGDVYSTTGTYGTSEAAISGFNLLQNGTLASRVKIVDSEGNEYSYGTDFEISSKKVVWKSTSSSYAEPKSYTVNYNTESTQSASVTQAKATEIVPPSSFTVSYTAQLQAPTSVTANSNTYQALNSLVYSDLAGLDGLSSTAISGVTGARYIVPDDPSELTLSDGTTDYVYGSDYILRSPTGTNSYPIISWYGDTNTSSSTKYIDDYTGTSTSHYNSQPTAGTLTLSYTHTYESQNGISSEMLAAAGANLGAITITDSDGNTYTNGTDFTVSSDGTINWTLTQPSADDDFDITDLQTAYGSTIPTVTLTDSDGVLRTYLDPSDRSLFTMTSGSTEYEYGRDYVLRVNDAGDGYVITWTVTSDTNGDGITDIKDANPAASAYTAYKKISTSGWKQAPGAGGSYTFAFEQESGTSKSVDVTASGSAQTLKSLLGVDVDGSLYGTDALTISNGDLVYRYGSDYKISDGKIEWITLSDTPKRPENGTKIVIHYGTADSGPRTVGGDADNYDLTEIVGVDDETVVQTDPSGFKIYSDPDGDEEAIEYVYGVDYLFDSNGYIHWRADDYVIHPTGDYTLTYEAYAAPEYTDIYNGGTTQNVELTVDSGSGNIDGNKLSYEQVLKDGSLSSNFTLTVNNTAYTYGTDYTIIQGDEDSTSGEHGIKINWITTPAAGTSFTLKYIGRGDDGGEVITTSIERSATDTINPDTSTVVTHKYADWTKASEIRITDGTETFLIDPKATSAQDCTGDGYLVRGSNGDAVIVWKDYDTVSVPTYSSDFQNATSTTVADSSGTTVSGYRITYEDNDNVVFTMDDNSVLAAGTYTLTAKKGSQTNKYTLTSDGTNMTLSGDEALDYEQDFEGATFTLTDANDAEITGYTLSYGGSGKAAFTMNDGSTLDAGTYTVKTVKNGRTTLYDLVSDGSTMTLQGRSSLWETQDNSKAGTYSIYVTTDGATETFTGTRPAGSYDFSIDSGATYPSVSDLQSGTTTITQGSKTFYEGVDYTIGTDDDGNAAINWITGDDGYEWYYPNPGTMYNINYTATDGTTNTYTAMRSNRDVLDMSDLGMTKANGSISVQYGDGLSLKLDTSTTDEGNTIRATYSVDVEKTGVLTDSNGDPTSAASFVFNWRTPTLTPKSNMPSYGSEVEIEYEYTQNTFTLDDDCSGSLLSALGLNDEANITEAHNAIIKINGDEYQRDSNNIGEAYGNELIKGMTLNLKGTGEVSIDVFQDAEKAVEGINTFMENYNSLMSWMNTRMTESEVDKDTASTIDSDDFRMRWGLLHGDSLLRQTKSQMRNLMAQTFTYSFTQRVSASEIYGTLANNGLRNDATLRLRIGGTYMDLTLLPTHSLQDVVDMINDSTNVEMHNNFYDETGKLREQPLLKASIEDDKLVITSTGSDTITMSGTSAMNALKMNYTYSGLFQLGLSTTSTDYGKSGELEFDESKFMEALEDNPDEVQEMMLMFASNMDSWLKSMLTTSSSGETSGTLTRRIEDIDTRIASIDEYLEKYQDRLDRQEEALRTKYAAAEQSIAQLSQQASSIAAILNQLNGYTNSNSNSSSS